MSSTSEIREQTAAANDESAECEPGGNVFLVAVDAADTGDHES